MTDRIAVIREEMEKRDLAALVFSGSDPHGSEYVAPCREDRRWVSGFTGSAGTLVLTRSSALLWTDSRYWLQASGQLDGTGIELMKSGQEDVPTYDQWLAEHLQEADRTGVDFTSLPLAKARELSSVLKKEGIELVSMGDLLDTLWTDRPELPAEPVYPLDIHYVGISRGEKIDMLRKAAEDKGARSLLLSALDDVAWTLNLRGSDIAYNPLFYSYLLIDPERATLFVRQNALSSDLLELLKEEQIEPSSYDLVGQALSSFPQESGALMLDPSTISLALRGSINRDIKVVEATSPASLYKAEKHPAEIEGLRIALKKDSIALIRFWMRLERAVERGDLDELALASMLFEERSAMAGFVGESFHPIVGFREHGAVIHYQATMESSKAIGEHGLLLIDSGGQYLEGTTDITRVFLVGEANDEERHDYTMVLKAHIALATATFPRGTPGIRIDALARKPLWDAGLDYGHGTGHGVGAFLNVHEGPQSISAKMIPVPIKPGMVCSNEPGIYREGKHGIRLENLIVARERFETPFGSFYNFETLTPFPFELSLLEQSLLTSAEQNWIRVYHEWVYKSLSADLDPQQRRFLAGKCGLEALDA